MYKKEAIYLWFNNGTIYQFSLINDLDKDDFVVDADDGEDENDEDFKPDVELKKSSPRKKSAPKVKTKKATVKSESNKYTCSFCSQDFVKRCDMRLHIRTEHTNVQCDECDKKCATPR